MTPDEEEDQLVVDSPVARSPTATEATTTTVTTTAPNMMTSTSAPPNDLNEIIQVVVGPGGDNAATTTTTTAGIGGPPKVDFRPSVVGGTAESAAASSHGEHSDHASSKAARNNNNNNNAQNPQHARTPTSNLVVIRLNSFFLLAVVPFLLLVCILLRINFQSIIYLFMLLMLPFFYPITYQNVQGCLRKYLIGLVVISLLGLLGQLIFQIVLLANQPYGNSKILPNCSFKQEILEEFGYSRYDTAYLGDIFRILVPDVLLLIASLVSLNLGRRLQKIYVAARRELIYNATGGTPEDAAAIEARRTSVTAAGVPAAAATTFTDHFCPLGNVQDEGADNGGGDGDDKQQQQQQPHSFNQHKLSTSTAMASTTYLNRIHHQHNQHASKGPMTAIRRVVNSALPFCLETTFLLLLFSSGSAWPSVLSAPYLLVSLALLVRWSLAYDIQHTRFQATIKIGLLLYSALHTLVLYLYQIHLFQTFIEPLSFVARLLGFTQFVYTDCEQPAHFYLNWETVKWQEWCAPFFVLALFWFIAVEFAYYSHLTGALRHATAVSAPSPTLRVVGASPRQSVAAALDVPQNNTDTDTDNDLNEKQVILDRSRSSSRHTLIYTKKKPAHNKKRLFKPDVSEIEQLPAVKLRRFRTGSQATTSRRTSSGGASSSADNTKARPSPPHSSQRSTHPMYKRKQTAIILEVSRNYFYMTTKFLHKQSYLLSLLSMMAWSILYHSILTLVLLVWACLIWVLPNSRHRCLKTSPLFLLYSTMLLLLEFIYGLQLNSHELPEFKEVGLYRHYVPFLHLAVKTLMLLFYCLTVRQYITERRARRLRELVDVSSAAGLDSNQFLNAHLGAQSQLTDMFYALLVKYWIFLSSGTLLFMSCQNQVVAYRIGYMALFLYFITAFQLHYSFWRMTLYIFHLVVIIYSMLVLLLIYVFQFEEVPEYVKRVLHIDDLVLSSLGFEKFASKDELIVRLLTPTTFLIVNILQIHYFNKPWLDLTKMCSERRSTTSPPTSPTSPSDQLQVTIVDMESRPSTSGLGRRNKPKSSDDEHEEDDNDDDEPTVKLNRPDTLAGAKPPPSPKSSRPQKEKFVNFLKRMLANIYWFYSLVCPYIWRLGELHIYKIIVLVIALFAFNKVNLLNWILLSSLLFSFLTGRSEKNTTNRVQTILCGFVQIWVCVLTLASMLYQLEFVESPLVFNCSFASNRTDIDPFLLRPEDNLVYIGIEKSNDILEYLKYYIFIFLLLTFQKIIEIKMIFYRGKLGVNKPKYSTLFENVTYRDIEKSFLHCAMYLVNYGFYRFGLEICLFMSSIAIITRMDAYAILYGIWLGIFLRLKRKTIRKIWTGYFMFLIFLLPLQYIWCLGLPPILCYEYPWSASNQLNPGSIINRLRLWLFLPDYSDPPSSYQLVADFFQIFFVWLQMKVFHIESSQESDHEGGGEERDEEFANQAGRNNELIYETHTYRDNPYKDFVSETLTYFDKFRYGIFMYSYWLVLAIVYLTGTSRISLLCIGYVIVSFFFLWLGQTFLMKPLEKLLKYWNILVFYCFMVIFIKACLQIVMCLLPSVVNDKSIVCILIDLFGIDCRSTPSKKDHSLPCQNDGETSEMGLIWDVFCFLVLILQRRLYMSYMFEHVVNEYKAQSTLAARGAKIFKEIINHKVALERTKEVRILEKLKLNVERIRRHQSKECAYEPAHHYEALRSGDYYMFNAEFEIETTEITESEDDLLSSVHHHRSDSRRSKKKESTSTSKKSPVAAIEAASGTDEVVDPSGVVVLPAEDPSKQPITSEETTDPAATAGNRQSWLTIENKTVLTVMDKLVYYFLIGLDFVIDYLNKYSKDFRHVSHILSKEKLILKRQYGNTQTPSLLALLKSAINKDEDAPPTTTTTTTVALQQQPSLHEFLAREDDYAKIIAASADVDNEMNSQTRTSKLLSAIFYFMMSQSEFICYFFMILNHLNSASLLSVPLPISIFLWAMLCIPRPTKTFWITSITYIEAVVVIKYLFQFNFLPWNASSSASNENLIKVLMILGIDKQTNFAVYDLFALLVIFLHRTILKRLGLWRDFLEDDELLLASNDEEKKAHKKELSKIGTNIYREPSPDDPPPPPPPLPAEEQQQQQETATPEETTERENQEEDDDMLEGKEPKEDETTSPEEEDEEEEEMDPEAKKKLAELENSYNCLVEDELIEDSVEKEKLRERIKEKIEETKKLARKWFKQVIIKRLVNPFVKFYNDMKTKHYAVVVDCYAKIFLCDFINCLITVFTYQYFGESARTAAKGTSSAISSIQDNKVPYSFLIMFLVQFILMIIDRALYLRKNRQGKFIFQVVLVLFVHVWVFFVLPYITKLNFVDNKAAQVWYFVKCIYFGYSSRQIRCGYPTRILGNFLTKSYSYVNLVLFKGFLLVPFLLELRSLMDWMFTDTSLGLSDWLQMEDIYSNIFVLKCFRYNENKYPTPRGQKRQALIKYGFGGLLLAIIILIIWFPLLLFSFSEGFNKSLPPQSCKVEIELSGFMPIYSMTSQQRQAQKYTKQMLDEFKKFAPEQAYSFLNDFTPDDVYCIAIPGNSTSTWQISPPSLESLKELLNETDPIDFDFIYSVTRESSEEKNVQMSEVVTSTRELLLGVDIKKEILNLLNNPGPGSNSNGSVLIESAYPRYVHARVKGHVLEIDSLKYSDNLKYYVDVRMALRNASNQMWWDVYDDNKDDYRPPCSRPGYLTIIVFSDKVSPSSISFITEQGIIGIYITIVLALSRFLRIMVVNSSQRIMFEQLPNVDRILKLCHSVYMVRENNQYELEEYLYAKIIFLYRSPETMIRYTKNDERKKNE